MSNPTTTVDAIEDAARKVDAVAALVECVGCACAHGYDFTEDMAAALGNELCCAKPLNPSRHTT